ncbi:MAG: hypothetical protein IT332_06120 [Ardenticatenales bacterium]|nr:hypothetical protein [Ardenticatenales bacterium]
MLFVDGIGWGVDRADTNPFAHAELPHLCDLLGCRPVTPVTGTRRPTLPALALDATMGVPGLPQSGTGQAALITGRNVAAAVGGHSGPFAGSDVQAVMAVHSLWQDARRYGAPSALATAYPERLIERVASGSGRLSAIARAAVQAGVPLRGPAEAAAGRAVPPYFSPPRGSTGRRPVVADPFAAGRLLAADARTHSLCVYEHFATDAVGHRGDIDDAVDVLLGLDAFVGGILSAWPADSVLVLMSDHGNLEDATTTQHTLAPALGAWRGPASGAAPPASVTEIAPAIRRFLGWAPIGPGGDT